MPDKFAWSEFEQLCWSAGETSWMKFIVEPTWMYLRRVCVGEPLRADTSSGRRSTLIGSVQCADNIAPA